MLNISKDTRQEISRSEPTNAVFSCDYTCAVTDFPHFWEHTVGSGHAALALRADWQAQLLRCRQELGFRHVRFHGILSDDMSTMLIFEDKPLYSFSNADRIMDFLLSIGMKPFVELSFMPSGISSGDKTAFHYSAHVMPPKDYGQWSALIRKLVGHWAERYGIDEVRQWFFEVWNEPNLTAFGTGKQEDYFKLYGLTVEAIKSVDQSLKVGGPATAKNAWIPDFITFCGANNLPIDFISTHHYPTDAFGKPGDDTITQLSLSKRSILREQAQTVKSQAGAIPVYYTEWCTSSNPRDSLHDEPYAAAFIVKTVMEATGLVEGYSYWTFSDIFEENGFPSIPFHGGFGLLNIHGIAKPSYRAYQLLHALGSKKLKVEGTHETVDAWVVRNDRNVTVLFTNFALPRHKIETVTVAMTITNIGTVKQATLRRIDSAHANPVSRWKEMGKPDDLKDVNLKKLLEASELAEEAQSYGYRGTEIHFEVSLPPLSVAAVTFQPD